VQAALTAHEGLAGDHGAAARDVVASGSAALQDVAGHDPELDDMAQRLREVGILLDEVAADLSAYAHGVEVDPARLAAVQERRAALAALQRKYGPSLADVLAWQEKAAAEAGELDHDDQAIADLEAEVEALEPQVLDLAHRMSEVRREAGARLADLVGEELTQLAMSKAAEWGFTPIIPPALVKPQAMEGTGFLGQAADDVYHLEKDDLYLVGTSEVPLAAYHSDEILDGPRHYAAFSPCFRREAGSHGRDTRGIVRVHWFDKVEMFVYTSLEESYAQHERILGFEKQWLDLLELPYRVIDVAAGDLGLSAVRKFDCEAWIPTQGKYREVSSASNCTQFQARRLDIRNRLDDGGTEPTATLNGTLCAMPRIIVALLENGQQADGSVRLPAALHPFLGEVLQPVGARA
jgi:hypothetical protein